MSWAENITKFFFQSLPLDHFDAVLREFHDTYRLSLAIIWQGEVLTRGVIKEPNPFSTFFEFKNNVHENRLVPAATKIYDGPNPQIRI